jgi:hypothetical protein
MSLVEGLEKGRVIRVDDQEAERHDYVLASVRRQLSHLAVLNTNVGTLWII